jgi:hypothetical protein
MYTLTRIHTYASTTHACLGLTMQRKQSWFRHQSNQETAVKQRNAQISCPKTTHKKQVQQSHVCTHT